MQLSFCRIFSLQIDFQMLEQVFSRIQLIKLMLYLSIGDSQLLFLYSQLALLFSGFISQSFKGKDFRYSSISLLIILLSIVFFQALSCRLDSRKRSLAVFICLLLGNAFLVLRRLDYSMIVSILVLKNCLCLWVELDCGWQRDVGANGLQKEKSRGLLSPYLQLLSCGVFDLGLLLKMMASYCLTLSQRLFLRERSIVWVIAILSLNSSF